MYVIQSSIHYYFILKFYLKLIQQKKKFNLK